MTAPLPSSDYRLHPKDGIYGKTVAKLELLLDALKDADKDGGLQKALLFPLGVSSIPCDRSLVGKLYWHGSDVGQLPREAPATRNAQSDALQTASTRLYALAHLYQECSRRLRRAGARAEHAHYALDEIQPGAWGQGDLVYSAEERPAPEPTATEERTPRARPAAATTGKVV